MLHAAFVFTALRETTCLFIVHIVRFTFVQWNMKFINHATNNTRTHTHTYTHTTTSRAYQVREGEELKESTKETV